MESEILTLTSWRRPQRRRRLVPYNGNMGAIVGVCVIYIKMYPFLRSVLAECAAKWKMHSIQRIILLKLSLFDHYYYYYYWTNRGISWLNPDVSVCVCFLLAHANTSFFRFEKKSFIVKPVWTKTFLSLFLSTAHSIFNGW